MKKLILTIALSFLAFFAIAQAPTFSVQIASKHLSNPKGLIAKKINFDSYTDFAVSNRTDTVTTFIGRSAFTYTASSAQHVNGISDFTIDTIGGGTAKHLITVSKTAKNILINTYLGSYAGSPSVLTFTSTPDHTLLMNYRGYSSFAVANLDSKGLYDFVIAGNEGIKILRDTSAGTYNISQKWQYSNGPVKKVELKLMNSDANLDMVFIPSSGNSYFVAMGDGHGNFASPIEHKLNTGLANNAVKFAFADTGTVRSAIVLSSQGSLTGLTVYKFGVADSIQTLTVDSVYAPGKNTSIVKTAEMNADHLTDLVTADADGYIRIYNGRFATKAKFAYLTQIATNEPIDYMEIGDFNGDGKNDIIYIGALTKKVVILQHN